LVLYVRCPGGHFINISYKHFAPIFWRQKLQSCVLVWNFYGAKLAVKKNVYKMLMKLTPGDKFKLSWIEFLPFLRKINCRVNKLLRYKFKGSNLLLSVKAKKPVLFSCFLFCDAVEMHQNLFILLRGDVQHYLFKKIFSHHVRRCVRRVEKVVGCTYSSTPFSVAFIFFFLAC